MANVIVKKHNVLNTASYSFTLAEQRLIWLTIIQSKQGEAVTADKPVEIHASAYAEHFGVTPQTARQALKDAANQLFDRRFTYRDTTENGHERVNLSRWVSKVAYVDDHATVEIHFSPDVIGFIKNLQENFCWFEIEQVAKVDSVYAGRLYELLTQWRSMLKTPKIELEELRRQLGVEEGRYPAMRDFKKRVLDLAVSEVSEKTDIIVSYEQFKRGRSITHISFSFKFRKPAVEIKAPKKPKKTLEAYGDEVINHLNMTRDAASQMASKMSFLPDDQLPTELLKMPPPKRANTMLHTLSDPEKWQELSPQLKAVGCGDLLS